MTTTTTIIGGFTVPPNPKTGKLLFVPIPSEYLPKIGVIITGWSSFEQMHDVYLGALLSHNAATVSGWERRNFRKRRDLFREQMKIAFAANPYIVKHLTSILNESATLYWKRNFLAHGTISVEFGNGTASIKAKGRHNGKITTETFGKTDLDTLAWDTSRLTGAMSSVIEPDDQFPLLSSPDKSVLRAFAQTNQIQIPT